MGEGEGDSDGNKAKRSILDVFFIESKSIPLFVSQRRASAWCCLLHPSVVAHRAGRLLLIN